METGNWLSRGYKQSELCCLLYTFWRVKTQKKIVHFLYIFHFSQIQIFEIWPDNSLDFLSVWCYVPLFISDFVNLDFVSLLISLNKGSSILLIFSKTHLFVPLTLCFIYFVSILLILVLKLIISWYLLLLGETPFFLF